MPQHQPDNDYGKRKEDGLELSGPYGLRARFSGDRVILAVLLILGFGIIGLMIRDHDLRTVAQVAEVKANVAVATETFKEQMEAVTYVLTLPESERKALKMDMPQGMRRKIREARNNSE